MFDFGRLSGKGFLTALGGVSCPLLGVGVFVSFSVSTSGGLVVGSARIDISSVSSGGGSKVSFESGANRFFVGVGTGVDVVYFIDDFPAVRFGVVHFSYKVRCLVMLDS